MLCILYSRGCPGRAFDFQTAGRRDPFCGHQSGLGNCLGELDKAQGARTELSATVRTKSKEETLEEAGIPKRTAYDYEQLTGGAR